MVQGTGSNVGKSLVSAGLCRALVRRGYKVAPFKPQNMSNNAAVTADGGEIGRAQALQAIACGMPPDVLMNPILLKPEAEQKAQLVVLGKMHGRYSAREYHSLKPQMLTHAVSAYQQLAQSADIVVIEGAGSPAEVNLRAGDVANMGFAEAIDAPVLLVADIHRGGVIANIIGTHLLLEPSEQRRLLGYIINQFRGDPALFWPACDTIESYTQLKCWGILPYFAQAVKLPAEDAMEIAQQERDAATRKLKIAVPRLSRIANFDDLDPLLSEPQIALDIIQPEHPLPRDADVIILPGSKATIADLLFLRQQGWDIDIHSHVRHGGAVVGICAGYQMLGQTIADPLGLEGKPRQVDGLGLLSHHTTMARHKHLREILQNDSISGQNIHGYEMHIGESTGDDPTMLRLDDQDYGGRSADGRVQGCYVHGLFASDAYRAYMMQQWHPEVRQSARFKGQTEATLDQLAQHLEEHLDIDALIQQL